MGPLAGIRIIELAGLGAGPYAAMLLSDLGAELIRVDRVTPVDRGVLDSDPELDFLLRGRRSVAVDLKRRRGVEVILRLVETADALIESFRPGVCERLGLGPEPCLRRNPKLIYGRMTGWGQSGPLAPRAGHDINYVALTGALHAVGTEGGPPVPPLNLLGDFGGGGLFLALGLVSALLEASRSGRGQVVDAAMVDGTASLMTMIYGLHGAGSWVDERGRNLLDTGAPFYGVYETSDGKYVAVGALEPQFFDCLVREIGLGGEELPAQDDRSRWPELHARLAAVFKKRSRAEWCEILQDSDACFAPVLSLGEAPQHPHMKARDTFVEVAGKLQPGPAPRFSRTRPEIRNPPTPAGADTDEVLAESGFSSDEIAELRSLGVVAGP